MERIQDKYDDVLDIRVFVSKAGDQVVEVLQAIQRPGEVF